jgi:hypothetical protein
MRIIQCWYKVTDNWLALTIEKTKERTYTHTHTFWVIKTKKEKTQIMRPYKLIFLSLLYLFFFICYYHMRLTYVCTCYVCLSNFTIWNIACIFLSNRKRIREKSPVDGDSIMCRYYWEIRREENRKLLYVLSDATKQTDRNKTENDRWKLQS